MLSLTSPVRTPYHSIAAGPKLIGLSLFTVLVFQINEPGVLAVIAAAVAALYAVQGWTFFRLGLSRLKPLLIFAVVILIWHVFTRDLAGGLAICLRLGAVVGLANLVTMTTRLDALLEIATRAFAPLRSVGVKPGLIGFSVALVIRFIPVLLERGQRLLEAWRARSSRRVNWNILTPIVLTVLDDADHVAEALRARGGLNNFD